MHEIQRVFLSATIHVFEFLEKDYRYKRTPKLIEVNHGRGETDSIIRYIGNAVAIDVIWHHDTAVMNVEFTELSDGTFPQTRYFWGDDSGKSRAVSLATLVVMHKGNFSDFLLGDITQTGFAKIKKREELIRTDIVSILQNLKSLTIEYASEIINGNLSRFDAAIKYQQGIIDKRTSNP